MESMSTTFSKKKTTAYLSIVIKIKYSLWLLPELSRTESKMNLKSNKE